MSDDVLIIYDLRVASFISVEQVIRPYALISLMKSLGALESDR